MPNLRNPLEPVKTPRLNTKSADTGADRAGYKYGTAMYSGAATGGSISMTRPRSTANLNRQKPGELTIRKRK